MKGGSERRFSALMATAGLYCSANVGSYSGIGVKPNLVTVVP